MRPTENRQRAERRPWRRRELKAVRRLRRFGPVLHYTNIKRRLKMIVMGRSDVGATCVPVEAGRHHPSKPSRGIQHSSHFIRISPIRSGVSFDSRDFRGDLHMAERTGGPWPGGNQGRADEPYDLRRRPLGLRASVSPNVGLPGITKTTTRETTLKEAYSCTLRKH